MFQGVQPGGYEIRIEGILETENSLEVSLKAFEPGERCGITGAITEPFHIVEISKTQKKIVFFTSSTKPESVSEVLTT